MSLQIINPGFLTQVQDYGRYGLQKYGITNSGPMDEHAFLWANQLLGNEFNAAQLEICMGGFAARFELDAVISVCGAEGNITINHQKIEMWKSIAVKAGDEIRVDAFSSGLYAYLAIKGGFTVEHHLHSAATVMREKLGGLNHDGQKLANKERVLYRECCYDFSMRIPPEFKPEYGGKVEIRFIPNYSETGCSESVIQAFSEQEFIVTPEINRMGYRLKGEAIHSDSKGIISQGISVGAIQLPKDGQPIVLMKDRQTIGGYPQIGCVAYLDLAKLSQSTPGSKVSFMPVKVGAIESELRTYLSFFNVSYSIRA